MRESRKFETYKKQLNPNSERISRDVYFRRDKDKKIKKKLVLHRLKDIMENKTGTKKSPLYII